MRMHLTLPLSPIVALCSSIVLAGCGSNAINRPEGRSAPALDPSGSVYVAMPANGSYAGKDSGASGFSTSVALADAFASRCQRVERATEVVPTGQSRAAASTGKFTYYAEPTIVHWEDRATEWSGRLDRIEIRIDLYDVAAKNQIDSATIKSSSAWATFGGDHPQDLLASAFAKYVAELYQATPAPERE